MSRRLAIAIAAAAPLVVVACSLTTSLDGYTSGGLPSVVEAGSGESAPPGDGAVEGTVEAGPDAAFVYRSCADVKVVSPTASDGDYTIDPDGPGPIAPFVATCDLTSEGGGWMLVTLPMIADRKEIGVTRQESVDGRGGVVVRGFANNDGCGAGLTPSSETTLLRDTVPWTQLRARFSWVGSAACWTILGGGDAADYPSDPNMQPFTVGVDTAREAVRMSGSNGDSYGGNTQRCDNDTSNFWLAENGPAERSVIASLRRRSKEKLAGLGTQAACVQIAPGTSSPTSWEYRSIYIR